jgi:hypothetical protein
MDKGIALGKGRGQFASLRYTWEFVEQMKRECKRVFKGLLNNYSEQDKIILLMKAYSNMAKDCYVIEISEDVPEEEIDKYKQYDNKVSVKFITIMGIEHRMFMSRHLSGREQGFYHHMMYLYEKEKRELLEQEVKDCRIVIEHLDVIRDGFLTENYPFHKDAMLRSRGMCMELIKVTLNKLARVTIKDHRLEEAREE